MNKKPVSGYLLTLVSLLVACGGGATPDPTPSQGFLDVTVGGGDNGTVTSAPDGINCGSTCSAAYPNNTSVTLTATPMANGQFVSWGGACQGTTPTCTVTVNSSTLVTASFMQPPPQDVLQVSAGANGTVTSAPAGINCGSTCIAQYLPDTRVTLTATPMANAQFVSWGGACQGTTPTCTVTVSSSTSVTASFMHDGEILTVTKTGGGTGTVSSQPAGISCGATCSNGFDYGTLVTLTASPAPASDFAGWSGACTNQTGTCQVTMNQAQNVTAQFAQGTLSLVAGNTNATGSSDGTGAAAGFNLAAGFDFDSVGNLYVADEYNHTIRKVVSTTGMVTTVAGTAGMTGSTDGIGTAALFNYPSDAALDGAGNLYVVDQSNNTIRKVARRLSRRGEGYAGGLRTSCGSLELG